MSDDEHWRNDAGRELLLRASRRGYDIVDAATGERVASSWEYSEATDKLRADATPGSAARTDWP